MVTSPPAPPLRGISAFFDGMLTFFEGVKFLLLRPPLMLAAFIPFLITVGLFIGITIFAVDNFADWSESFFADKTAWYWTWTGAEFLIWLVFILLLGALCFLTFVSLGSMITSPFSDYISQKVELELLPEIPSPAGGVVSILRDALRSMKHEAGRLAIYLTLVLLFTPLLLVPFLGQLAFSVVMTIISIRYLAWDGLDYCFARRRLRFHEKMAFLKARRARTLGYGTISFILLAIPFTTLFVLPLNAVGGTILYCRIVRAEDLITAPA